MMIHAFNQWMLVALMARTIAMVLDDWASRLIIRHAALPRVRFNNGSYTIWREDTIYPHWD